MPIEIDPIEEVTIHPAEDVVTPDLTPVLVPYDFRNPAFNQYGTIDLEIDHPQFGWLPFTASPNDSEERGRDLYARASAGAVAPYVPALPTIEDYQAAIQSLVDSAAVSRRYDDGNSLAGYVASTIPAWAAEAQVFVAWRDAVWAHAYTELDKVMNGQRPQPGVADFLAELPPIVWPA